MSNSNSNYLLSQNEYYLKQFLQFVGKAPNVQSAVFLLYNNKNTQPQKLFDCYEPFIKYSSQKEDLFCTLTLINNKQTAIYGINSTFLSLKDDKQNLTSKHLILLYILRKYPSIKICFCFDKDTVNDSSFRTVKQLFQRLAFLINYQQIKQCSKSFIILLYNNNDQTIIDKAKINLQKSIQQKNFYKENQKLVQDIYNSTVKQNNFIQINKNLQSEQVIAKKNYFQELIEKLYPIQYDQKQKGMPISDLFLNILQYKSASWKIFKKNENLTKSQLDKTQSSTKSNKQNSQIHLLFTIWQDIFENTIKYIVKKLKNPKNNFSQFHRQSKYLLQNDCDKYVMPKTNLLGLSAQSQKVFSLDISKIFLKVVDIIININKHKKDSASQNAKNITWNKYLLDFIHIFYQSKVFDLNKKQKSVFDSFMIFNQLYEILYPIRDVQNKKLSFFSDIKMMLDHINEEMIIKSYLLQNLSKIFIYQLQVDLNRAKKGQLILLERLSIPLKKIKSLINEKEFEQILSKQRIQSALQQFQAALFEQKIKKLSKTPNKKILYILESLRNQKDLIEKKDVFIQLAKTLLSFLQQNKIKDVSLELKKILIDILSIDFKEMRLIIKIYQKEFESILRNSRKLSVNLSQQESQFLGSFIEYLIKIGYVDKARQKAYVISQIDEDLSKRLLLKCQLKTNSKRQFQFVKNQLSPQKIHLINQQLSKSFQFIQRFFKDLNSNLSRQYEKIDQILIDI